MNPVSFWRAVLVALLLSLCAAALHAVALLWLGSGMTLRLLLVVLSLGYLAFLVQSSKARFGVSLLISGWCGLSAALLLFNPPLAVWLLAYSGLIWLARSCMHYERIVPALADAGITGLALCGAVATAMYSHSILLSVWSYFLAQAFCTCLPARQTFSQRDRSGSDTRFEQARSSAEQSLQRLRRQPSN